MTEQIMTNQHKRAKKSARMIEYAKKVVDVGEELSAKEIMYRMNHKPIESKLGKIPSAYVPRSTTSLGMRLKGSPYFTMISTTPNNKSHFLWRRVE